MRHLTRRVGAMRSPHHHIRRGLTHPNRLVAAATWLLLLVLLSMLVWLAGILVTDLWLILLAWMQP